MCGIIGYVGPSEAYPILLGGLGRLEYRGYDSAGVATIVDSGKLEIRRAKGKLENLAPPAGRLAPARPYRNRAHAMGDAWPPVRGKRASAQSRPGRGDS